MFDSHSTAMIVLCGILALVFLVEEDGTVLLSRLFYTAFYPCLSKVAFLIGHAVKNMGHHVLVCRMDAV
jgi:hypothetical protein